MRDREEVHAARLRPYRDRLVDSLLADLLVELPGVLVVGPRASGKTTTAVRHARTVVRLDREAEAVAFRADPDAALRGLREPVLLDEWQAVPAVLGAVKRAIDAEPRPGRFLITGSVRADLDAEVWPATGRLVRVSMFGMTQRELTGRLRNAPILDRLAVDGAPDALDLVLDEVPDLRGYVALALRGGFPNRLCACPSPPGSAGSKAMSSNSSRVTPSRSESVATPFACVAISSPTHSTPQGLSMTGRCTRPPTSTAGRPWPTSDCSRTCWSSNRCRPGARTG